MNKRHILSAAIIYLLCVIIFYFPVVVGEKQFWEDFYYLFFPLRYYLISEVKHGNIPFWCPYVFGGYPFLMDPNAGALYPLNLLLLPANTQSLYGTYRYVEIWLIFHAVIAGILLMLFLYKKKLSLNVAIIGGLTYMFCTTLSYRVIHFNWFIPFCYLPGIFLAWDEVLNRRYSYIGCTTLLTFLCLSAGGGQFIFMLYVLITIYTICKGIIESRSLRLFLINYIGILVLFIALSAIVSAVIIYPTMLHLPYTARGKPMTYKEMVVHSLQWRNLIRFCIPNFFGIHNPESRVTYWGDACGYGYGNFWESGFYIGILPLLTFIIALFMRNKPVWIKLFLIMSIVTFLLAWGEHLPGYRWLASIPFWARFRVPSRFMLFCSFFVITTSMWGLDQLLRGRRPLRAWIIVPIVMFITLLIIAMNPPWNDVTPSRHTYAVRQFSIFTVLFFLSLAILLSTDKLRKYKYISYPIGIIVFVDLMINLTPFVATHMDKRHMFPDPRYVRLIRRYIGDEPARINVRQGRLMVLQRNDGLLTRLQLVEGYTIMALTRRLPTNHPRYLDLWNAKLVFYREGDKIGLRPNPDYLPRVFTVDRYVVASDSIGLQLIKEDTFDYRNVAILNEDPHVTHLDTAAIARIIKWSAHRIEIATIATDTAIVILSELWYPLWKATLDGHPIKTYRAYTALRGFVVPPGRHIIVSKFDTTPFKLGSIITLLGIMLIGFISWRFSHYKVDKCKGRQR